MALFGATSILVLCSAVPSNAEPDSCPYSLASNPPKESGRADAYTCLVDDFYPLASDPLGNRTPLILIHGINGNGSSLDTLDWTYFDKLKTSLYGRGPSFTSSYKIYLFHYVSNQYSVSELGQSLRNWLDFFRKIDSNFDKPVVIVAHSMGGLVARAYMNERNNDFGRYQGQRGGENVLRLITLATPHLGTPSANRLPRLHGSVTDLEWGALLNAADTGMWAKNGCTECLVETAHPNRGDLCWAGRGWPLDIFADTPSSLYEENESERNDWLAAVLPKTYDSKIIAYYGAIGAPPPDSTYASDGPTVLLETALAGYLGSSPYIDLLNPQTGDQVTMTVAGVILERIYTNQFGYSSTVPYLANDGVVPIESGSYMGGTIQKRVSCEASHHWQMENGDGGDCTDPVANTKGRLFDTVFADLQALTPGPPPQTPPGDLTIDPPASYAFATTAVGSSRTRVFTLDNSGDAALTINSIAISGPYGGDFTLSNAPPRPFAISPGVSQTFDIAFHPSSAGSETASLTVNYTADIAKSTTITLSGTAGAPASCQYSLSTSNVGFGAKGGSGSFQLNTSSGCSWTVSSDSSWATVNIAGTESGTQTVMLSVQPTTNEFLRVANVSIQGGSQTLKVLISEDGTASSCTLSLSPGFQSIGSAAATNLFNVITGSNCHWGITPNSPWIPLTTSAIRLGSSTVGYNVAANPSNTPRTGTMTVSGDGGTVTFTVAQAPAAATCTYSLPVANSYIIYQGANTSFSVAAGAGCPWEASSSADWLTIISGSSSTGVGLVQLNVAANPSTSPRTGSILVQANGQTFVYTVTQFPMPSVFPSISLPVTSFNLGNALVGGTSYQTVVIQNNGAGVLYIGDIYLSSGTSEFSAPSTLASILPSQTGSFTISLTPTSAGTKSATFRISTVNDPNHPTVDVTVMANAVPQGTGGIDFVWANQGTVPERTAEDSYVTSGPSIYIYGNHEWRYDPTVPAWTDVDNPTVDPIDGGAALINGSVYLKDGFGSAIAIDQLSGDTWSFAPSMPDSRAGASVASVNGKLYVIGGLVTNSGVLTVEEFDPATGMWTQKKDMPTARGYAGVAVVNNIIYVIGGQNGQYLPVTEAYDPSNDTWVTRELMPTARSFPAIAVIQNKIEVIGGLTYGTPGQPDANLPHAIANVEEFDPSKPDGFPGIRSAWAIRNPLSTARYGAAAGTVNNAVYVLGGGDPRSSTQPDSIEVGNLSAAPAANVPIRSVDFGSVPLQNAREITITVQNTGNALLTLSETGGDSWSKGFTVDQPSSIPAGQSVTVRCRFTPASIGSQIGTLMLSTNDPLNPSVTLTFTGTGTAQPTLPIGETISTVGTIPLAATPDAVVVDDTRFYVTTYPNPTLWVLNKSSNTVQGSIVLSSPSSNPNTTPGIPAVLGSRAYVPLYDFYQGQLAIVDVNSDTLLSYVPTQQESYWTGVFNNSIYVLGTQCFSDGSPNLVQVFNSATNTFVSSIPAVQAASGLAIDSSTGRAYVTAGEWCGSGAKPVVFDANTNAAVGSIAANYSTQAVAISGTRAYILESGLLDLVDISSNQILQQIPVYPGAYSGARTIAALSSYVFIATNLGPAPGIYVIDPARALVVSYIPTSDVGRLTADQSTNTLYVTNPNAKTVTVLKLNQAGFTVSCANTVLTAAAGGTATLSCSVTSAGAYTGMIRLSCADLPVGNNCSINPSSVTLGSTTNASLSVAVSVGSSALPGVYAFKIEGADASSVQSANVALVVPTCVSFLGAANINIDSGTNSGTVPIFGTAGCAWTAASNAPWLTIASGSSGSANGSVSFSAAANSSVNSRTGTLTIAGQTFTVTQAGVAVNTPSAGIYDDRDLSITYNGSWNSNLADGRYNRTQTFSNLAGSTASFTFNGTQVTYLYEAQSNMGHAQVSIDGSIVTADVDEFAATGQAQQRLTYGGLTSGTHTITVAAVGSSDSQSNGAYVIVDAFIVGPAPAGTYDDRNPQIIYGGTWGSNTADGRYDGTQTFSNIAESTATFTFSGTQVTYLYEAQWNLGHAQVSIDGVLVTPDLDEFAATGQAQQRLTYGGLTNGPHTITVTAMGTKDSQSAGAYVIIDAFIVGPVGPGIYDDRDAQIIYNGSWGSNLVSGRYNGTQTFSNTPGSTASFTFTGTQVTYLYEAQSNMGQAQVTIDGTVVTADVDEFAALGQQQRKSTYLGLTNGTHTITVTVLGTPDAQSSGAYVIVDAFIVGPALTGMYDDRDPQIVYSGSWSSNTAVGRYDGTQSFSNVAGSTATFTFTGTQVTYLYEAQWNLGHAQVSIDGTVVTPDVNEFAAVGQQQQKLTYGGLTNGTHTITVMALGASDAQSAGAYVIVDAFLVGPAPAGVYDDGDPQIVYSGSWGSNTANGRYNGTQTYSNVAGSSATLTFNGTQVTYLYEAQSNMGHAQVSIDGNVVTSDVDEFAAVGQQQQKLTYSGLTDGAHTITVTALGNSDAQSAGSYVIVDAFLVGPAPAGAYDDGDPQVVYNGNWNSNTAPGRYNGTQSFSNAAGSTASFTFSGTQISYLYEAQANMGHAQVSIDGVVVTPDLDEFAATGQQQQTLTYSGLGMGVHTITVTALGAKDPQSTNDYVIIDAFLVAP